MNIIKIAEQAGFFREFALSQLWLAEDEDLEYFAKLIRQDEAKSCAEHYLGIMRDAVEQAVLKEREACAALLDELAKEVCNKNFIAVDQRQFCAKQIRARSKPDEIRARGEK